MFFTLLFKFSRVSWRSFPIDPLRSNPPLLNTHIGFHCMDVLLLYDRFSNFPNLLIFWATLQGRVVCTCICLRVFLPVYLQEKVLELQWPGQRSVYFKFGGRYCQTAKEMVQSGKVRERGFPKPSATGFTVKLSSLILTPLTRCQILPVRDGC